MKMMDYLDLLQKINNKLFELFGLKDFIIDFQVYINTQRHIKDKTDITEIINEGFVQ